jgi:altronate dehydratase
MPNTADRLLRLSPADNVAVAIVTLEAGETAVVEGAMITAVDRIPAGHKIALAPIPAGAKVHKYGLPIGSATRDIRPGQHVHTHNLRSDYLVS